MVSTQILHLRLIGFFSLLFTILFGCCFATNALADDSAEVRQHIYFGSIVQLKKNASITLGTDGTSTFDGISVTASNEVKSGLIHYSNAGGHLRHTVTIPSIQDFPGTGNQCTIKISMLFDPQSFQLYAFMGDTAKDVKVGATLSLDGFCADGPYSIPVTIQPTTSGSFGTPTVREATITCSFTITSTLGIGIIQNLNFGEMISPTGQSTVTVTPEGNVSSTGGIYLINRDVSPSAGIFKVSGMQGREVNVTLPSSVGLQRIGGTEELTAHNFVTDKGTKFTMGADEEQLRVGATLTVPAGTDAGTYQGEYTITVSY